MEKDRIATLLDKYRRGTITGEEKVFLENWYQQYREADSQGYPAEEMLEDSAAVRAALRETVLPRRNRGRVLYAAAAAAILVVAGILTVYRNSLWPGEFSGQQLAKAEAILPGGNKATLTLIGGDSAVDGAAGTGVRSTAGASRASAGAGATIQLNGNKEGIHSNGKAFQYDDGTAVDSRMPEGFHAQYALLTTPRGGQYQVRLPDGSKVWLNAGSSLKYPLTFDGVNQRRVVLTGEAYFEVVSDKRKPFVVSTQNQTMEVLGTKFNINSYGSVPQAKTTLLEGALRVTAVSAEGMSDNKSHLLAPGQQAVMDHGRVRVKQVDPEEAVAWKEGYFQFNNKNLETALAELARWYDVEVVFRNEKMRQQKLAGTISRYARISQVLEKMELTGMIAFQVKGRVIIVE